VEQITNQPSGAYARFVYESNANYVRTFRTVIDLAPANELQSWQILDGAGRVRATASDHPGSAGGYQGQYLVYDNLGRLTQQSNPTEMNEMWLASGDDSAWRYTHQAYDWKGRPTQTTNTDGSTQVVTYGGCGCAGGEATTVHEPSTRRLGL
jgi:hypothetical protein